MYVYITFIFTLLLVEPITQLLLYNHARRGGVVVTGWTVDQEIRVRFPAYPTACGPFDGKEVKDVFRRPSAHVGVGSAR